MRRYHHIGIPTKTARADETYLAEYKLFISGYDDSPYGVEWMRFDPDCPLPEIVKTVPHVAFIVDDLEEEINGRKVIVEQNNPSRGVRTAFIVDNDVPVEFIEFS